MEEKYKKALKEAYVILQKSPKEEFNKIPKTFLEFIEKNMNAYYEPKIDFGKNFENSVLEETLVILALIYREYLVTEEEKEEFIRNEEKQKFI